MIPQMTKRRKGQGRGYTTSFALSKVSQNPNNPESNTQLPNESGVAREFALNYFDTALQLHYKVSSQAQFISH
jgi:hypothetical protein